MKPGDFQDASLNCEWLRFCQRRPQCDYPSGQIAETFARQKHGKNMLRSIVARSTANRLVLSVQSVDHKSNEITAIPELFKNLELKGAIITTDAMGSHKENAAQIVEGGGD